MVFDTMKSLIALHQKDSNDANAINAFIADNIHPEPYLKFELVEKCIEAQKQRKRLGLGNIKEEDKLIACMLVGAYLDLNVYEDWLIGTVGSHSSVVLPVIKNYLLPKYAGMIAPLCENKVDFETELADYKPQIYMGNGHNKWVVKLFYGENYDSAFELEELTKETLKELKAKIDTINVFIKRCDEYLENREEFLNRVLNLLGRDQYQRNGSGIYADKSNNIHSKHLMIDVPVWRTCSVYHDFNYCKISMRIKIVNGYSLIADVCNKEVNFDEIDDLDAVTFFDLDEAYNKIKLIVDSGFRKVEFMD